ncbi:hypothetical protein Tco_1267673 [Tanacetum coccineum]
MKHPLIPDTEPADPLNHQTSGSMSAQSKKKEESPCLTAKALQIQEQDNHRAESSSSDSLTTTPKMVINSPCLNSKKELAIPEQTANSKESTNPLMADSLPKTIVSTKLVKPQGFNLRPNMAAPALIDSAKPKSAHPKVVIFKVLHQRLKKVEDNKPWTKEDEQHV